MSLISLWEFQKCKNKPIFVTSCVSFKVIPLQYSNIMISFQRFITSCNMTLLQGKSYHLLHSIHQSSCYLWKKYIYGIPLSQGGSVYHPIIAAFSRILQISHKNMLAWPLLTASTWQISWLFASQYQFFENFHRL